MRRHCFFPCALMKGALPDRLSNGPCLAHGPAAHVRRCCQRVRVHDRSPVQSWTPSAASPGVEETRIPALEYIILARQRFVGRGGQLSIV
eukprot:1374686-Pyramimonas_sp.AAC.1